MSRVPLALLALSLAGTALAADRPVTYKERTEIEFETLDLEGELLRPHVKVVRSRTGANFTPMIQLRRNWDDAMEQSVDEVR